MIEVREGTVERAFDEFFKCIEALMEECNKVRLYERGTRARANIVAEAAFWLEYGRWVDRARDGRA